MNNKNCSFSLKIQDDRASVATEFALVGLPFIIMLVGIIEVCLFFSTGITLDGATNSAARMIRTGQIQTSGNPVQTFENQMCDQVSGLINCAALQYQVTPITSNQFSNTPPAQFDANGNLLNQGFNPGTSSQDVLVRVVYQYTFLTPLIGTLITGNASSQATLMSTVVIENEPYQFGD